MSRRSKVIERACRLAVSGAGGRGSRRWLLMVSGFPGGDENALEFDGGGGHTTL